jgi:hypothetical protein
VAQSVGLEFKPQYCKKKKKIEEHTLCSQEFMLPIFDPKTVPFSPSQNCGANNNTKHRLSNEGDFIVGQE